ncbi:MAG: HD domain-containing protein [Alistipes sp.]|nr:HD domain-containing protein [Alistipes sp.]
MNAELVRYIENEIIPRYAGFDAAHNVDHVRAVIAQSMALAEHYDVDWNMVYAIAAYHDTGLVEGREHHHEVSRRIVLNDGELRRWFTPEAIAVMGDAGEDHRASSDHEPRTVYGRIVAEADRQIDADVTLRRTVQYTMAHYPEMTRDENFERCMSHLVGKYGRNGYLRLWIPESDNARRLEAFRRLIEDRDAIRRAFDDIYDSLTA